MYAGLIIGGSGSTFNRQHLSRSSAPLGFLKLVLSSDGSDEGVERVRGARSYSIRESGK